VVAAVYGDNNEEAKDCHLFLLISLILYEPLYFNFNIKRFQGV